MVLVVRVVLPTMIEDMKDMPWKPEIFFHTKIPWQVRQTNKQTNTLDKQALYFYLYWHILSCFELYSKEILMLLTDLPSQLTHFLPPSITLLLVYRINYRLVDRVWWRGWGGFVREATPTSRETQHTRPVLWTSSR